MENTETKLYDKSAHQVMTFNNEDDEKRYTLEFAIQEISDENLAEFDRLSFTKVTNEGSNQIYLSDDLDASGWFFDKDIELVGGFDSEELPQDWREYFGLLEKQAVVAGFIGVSVYVEEQAKFKQKFSFSNKTHEKTVLLKANFNGEEIICKHILPSSYQKHLRAFKQITTRLVNRKGQTGTFLPTAWKKLAALYDEMGISFEGYNGEPPINHKALVLHDVFDAQLEAERKK